MDHNGVLSALRREFEYRKDVDWDVWRIHLASEIVRGDCEDFALTLAWRLAGQRWWRFIWDLVLFRSVIWYVTTAHGVGHAVLWRRGVGWADNIHPVWNARTPHRRRFPFPPIAIALKLVFGAAYLCLYGTINRAKD